jgi:hypothetical protein
MMSTTQPLRPHFATDRPLGADAALTFIGTIRTPWTVRDD